MNVHVRSKERRVRLVEIERELSLLKKKKRSLERNWEAEAAEAALVETAPAGKAGIPGPAGATERPPVGGGISAGGANNPSDLEWAAPAEAGGQRERFASYFMSGNLGRSGPQLRKERRAQRNKAILMAVFALILLIVVVRFLVK